MYPHQTRTTRIPTKYSKLLLHFKLKPSTKQKSFIYSNHLASTTLTSSIRKTIKQQKCKKNKQKKFSTFELNHVPNISTSISSILRNSKLWLLWLVDICSMLLCWYQNIVWVIFYYYCLFSVSSFVIFGLSNFRALVLVSNTQKKRKYTQIYIKTARINFGCVCISCLASKKTLSGHSCF